MISKINKIQDFAIFNNFRWDSSTPPFKRYNLIYGWNYSGKTTLSRVFRCFELGQLHDDYRIATFELELEDGNKYDQLQLSQSFAIRVFNSDFIKDNLKWEEGIEPVLLVGEENIELEKQLKKHRAKVEEKGKKIDGLRRYVYAKNDEIENGLTNKARDIKNTLSLPDYDKRLLEPIVKNVSATPEAFKLPDEQVQPLIKIYQSIQKEDEILEIDPSFPDMTDLRSQTKMLLQKTATANIIKRLDEDSDLETWVESGVDLHEGKAVCQFCGSQLPDDLLDKLNAHFSEEYKCLKTEIEQLIDNLQNKKVRQELPDKARFYLELREDYVQSKENFETSVDTLNRFIDELVKKLEDKKTEPFKSVAFDNPQDNTDELKTHIKSVNIIIRKHNDKTDDFETERGKAKNKLIKHWASEFVIDIKYSETLAEIERKETESRNIAIEKNETQIVINAIEQKLSDAVKGAGKINEYLHGYFGTDELKMAVAEDSKYFKLERSGHRADNLSEGEKTAIAFSHFMTTLEGKGTTLDDMIIFIDDPVSSLDSNHLFHTYSFIKTKLDNCKQLFISTHNYEFFNLIKEWFKKVKRTEGDKSFYLVEKTQNGEDVPFRCNLKALPEPLSKFRSEYVYLFSLLHKFNENPQQDYNYLYILPNIVRRYLEAYVGFRTLGGLSGNLSILIENETQQEKLYKFINAYSHNSSSPRLLHFPDFSECRGVVDIVLIAVQAKDKNHYDALVEACGNGN